MNYFVCILNAKIKIKRKRFWMRQIFMERHSKGNVLILVKELKLFDHEFSLITLSLDILMFHSDVSQCLFCLLIGCTQQFYWLIILSNNLFRCEVDFFSTPKRKKISSTRKINCCVLSKCACIKFSWPLCYIYIFWIQSLRKYAF